MQKLCCVRTRQHPLPVWSHKFVISSLTHFSTNSHPFSVGIVSLRDPITYAPEFFTFVTPIRDLILRPTFTTSFRDPHSRPHFATPIHDSHLRLPFATHFRDSRLQLHSRLPIASPTATRYFLSRLPSCDSPTDGWTVLPPQHHLPSVPTLTLIRSFLEPSPWLGLYL